MIPWLFRSHFGSSPKLTLARGLAPVLGLASACPSRRMAPLLTVRASEFLTAIHCSKIAEQWIRQGCHGDPRRDLRRGCSAAAEKQHESDSSTDSTTHAWPGVKKGHGGAQDARKTRRGLRHAQARAAMMGASDTTAHGDSNGKLGSETPVTAGPINMEAAAVCDDFHKTTHDSSCPDDAPER